MGKSFREYGLWTIVVLSGGLAALANTASQAPAQSKDATPLQLETKIPLGDVRGRWRASALARPRRFEAMLTVALGVCASSVGSFCFRAISRAFASPNLKLMLALLSILSCDQG